MFNSRPEAFGPPIAAQRRSAFELAARHARVVRTLKRARKAERAAAQASPPAGTARAPKPRCDADIG